MPTIWCQLSRCGFDALTMGRGKRDGIGLLWDDSSKWVKGVSYEVNTTPGLVFTEIRIVPWKGSR